MSAAAATELNTGNLNLNPLKNLMTKNGVPFVDPKLQNEAKEVYDAVKDFLRNTHFDPNKIPDYKY